LVQNLVAGALVVPIPASQVADVHAAARHQPNQKERRLD
jgi:hypothetical protein